MVRPTQLEWGIDDGLQGGVGRDPALSPENFGPAARSVSCAVELPVSAPVEYVIGSKLVTLRELLAQTTCGAVSCVFHTERHVA